MPTPILICACITAFCACITALLLIFELSRIVTALGNIRVTLDLIHMDLVMLRDLVMLYKSNRKNNPPKQREYWRDQNGFRHWRKKQDA